MINLLLSCDYTVVFIGHEQEKNGFIQPKGDKRCLNPIIDNCDFVIYVKSNGVDDKGDLIKSSGYFYQTNEFFARSRFEHCPNKIDVFSAENLEAAIAEAVAKEEELNHAKVVSYDEQKEQNTTAEEDFESVMTQVQLYGKLLIDKGLGKVLTDTVEETLGRGGKVANCTERQIEAVTVIRDNLIDKCKSFNINID